MKRKNNWLNHAFNFLAVILGVYLAFYINEKAKTNEERKESRMLMHSLVSELSSDIKNFEDYQIPVNIEHQENIATLIEWLAHNDLANINSQLPTIFQVENNAPTTSTYSSMKASGKLKLIEDLTLQTKLSAFYEGLALECVRKSEYQVDFFTDELLGWLTENADLTTMEILNEEKLIILKNKLLIYESLIDQKVNNYKMVVEESKQLKIHLDSLLTKK